MLDVNALWRLHASSRLANHRGVFHSSYAGYMVFLFKFVSNKTYIEQYVKHFLCVKQIRKAFIFL